jgi:hypothetical protein
MLAIVSCLHSCFYPAAIMSLPPAAADVIRTMYDAINRRDLDAAIACVDEDCRYEDLNFPKPFIGREAVRGLFAEFCEGMPGDLMFAIDDLAGDDRAVGALWHLELGGVAFPNSRGASFYRISETTGKLCFARDLVEPPFKPGKAVLPIIKLVIPIVRRIRK